MRDILRLFSNFFMIFILFAILFMYAMFQGGFVSWFLFFSFLPIFIYHLGLLLYPIKQWKVTREISNHAVRAGRKISVKLTITRSIPFPLYYCIVEEVFPKSLMDIYYRDKYAYINEPKIPTFNRKFKKIIFPWFKRRFEVSYILNQIPRGEHQLELIRIRTGDIFGFIKKECTYRVHDQFVAYPGPRTIQLNEQPSSFEQGSTSAFISRINQSNVVSSVREYVPGDKFSQIDWKQTARKHVMMTKEFEQERSRDTMLVFNACYFEGISLLAFEGAVEMILSLSETLEIQGSKVGLLSVGEEVIHFPMQQDQKKKEWLRQHLTRIQATEKQPFSVQMDKELAILNNRSAVILVTTNIDASIVQSLQKVKQRMKQCVIILIQSTGTAQSIETNLIEQLRNEDIVLCILSEKDLMKEKIGVDI